VSIDRLYNGILSVDAVRYDHGSYSAKVREDRDRNASIIQLPQSLQVSVGAQIPLCEVVFNLSSKVSLPWHRHGEESKHRPVGHKMVETDEGRLMKRDL
jgi:hypothetical protein